MTLITFKYGLPVLLGFILFVGISGRFNPLRKPQALIERPSWFLGLWAALTVTLVLSLGLHLAYQIPVENARLLLKPTAWLLASLLLPGFFIYLIYRHTVKKELAEIAYRQLDIVLDNGTPLRDTAGELKSEETLDSELNAALTEMQINALHPDRQADTLALPAPLTNERSIEFGEAEAEAEDYGLMPELAQTATATSAQATDKFNSSERPFISRTYSSSEVDELVAQKMAGSKSEIEALRQAVFEQTSLREETEKHLRVIRKAMSVLETESRDYESSKADALIGLEEELENRIKETAAAEARANRMDAGRVELETHVVNLKQDLLQAKRDVRRNTAARARALSAANKTVAFARQSVKARARLESRLKNAEESLANRQQTISSLIKALEKEKRRTQADVSTLAKQLVLHEKQLHARRSLEEVARSVEGKLHSRLVKKVAKARPLSSARS